LNAVRPNSNSVRPNVNTGRANVNSVRVNVNSVRQNVNSVRSNVNTVRPKQPEIGALLLRPQYVIIGGKLDQTPIVIVDPILFELIIHSRTWKTDGVFISQDKYVANMLKKFDLASVKIAITPMETKMALTKDEEAEEVDR
ncbi:hypothetical protein Tco_0207875, partial [Tanacetum coccineum]